LSVQLSATEVDKLNASLEGSGSVYPD